MLTHSRTSFNVTEQRINVDLDADKGRPARANKAPDTVYCIIRPTKTIRMEVIGAYLRKQMAFDNSVLEAISMFSTNPKPLILLLMCLSTDFLDHLMRQYPSDQYTSQKRSFFCPWQGADCIGQCHRGYEGCLHLYPPL